MVETGLTKTILELDDIKKIEPDLNEIKIISRETCEKVQILIFAKEKNKLKILTTNNFPEQLQKIIKMLEDRSYKHEIFYTSTEAFKEALKRYDKYDKLEKEKLEASQIQREAAGKWAVSMIKQ